MSIVMMKHIKFSHLNPRADAMAWVLWMLYQFQNTTNTSMCLFLAGPESKGTFRKL